MGSKNISDLISNNIGNSNVIREVSNFHENERPSWSGLV
jgi:hypothetical protein